ncbi:hypothetical protein HYN48_12070 [Flavobacterium magnum]|uniref:DUF4932 domain-containing protein n=1 Tax=Flavobacterium magnum TaxID=2162713 RepID=A0A2S0RHR6_9FLAO|nr:hypothetical protein [Flavobacterium magnum]AWA30758.1 hypothetical protein HYN48_12070 [Flavobacterium magnum]
MHKLMSVFCFLFVFNCVFSQNNIQIKISKPYAIFNFLETAINRTGTSSTLNEIITANAKDNSDFKLLCKNFSAIRMDYSYAREEFPESRRQNRSVRDLIYIALVKAETWTEFNSSIIGILPNSEQQKMLSLLKQAEPYYDQFVWITSRSKLEEQITGLSQYLPKAYQVFPIFREFYGSSWDSSIPFLVTLYPIPGTSGISTAKPYANSLCVGVLTDKAAPVETIGVILHEMCHVLYDEQPNEIQQEIDKWFSENTSPYNVHASGFFDEGMATALGNGWAYKYLSGKLDDEEWYNNKYINGFAKALYPLVAQYIDQKKSIDKPFIDRAVDLFASTFPESNSDYDLLLSNVSVYTDAENNSERDAVLDVLESQFRLRGIQLSSPVLDSKSLEFLATDKQTQLVVIDRNHRQDMEALRKIFPQLKAVSKTHLKQDFIFSFLDDTNRPVILLHMKDKATLPALVARMKTLKVIGPNVEVLGTPVD